MRKKIFRLIALIMLIAGAVFVIFALNNPQLGFAWSNTVTYSIYIVYVLIMAALFIMSLKK